jgi:hypothetical protein
MVGLSMKECEIVSRPPSLRLVSAGQFGGMILERRQIPEGPTVNSDVLVSVTAAMGESCENVAKKH